MAVLDNAPERISEVPGISAKKGQQISKEYRKARGGRKIIMLLAPLGISARQALQLQMKLGKDAENLLKHHPYTVFESGYITFQTAEALAQSFGNLKGTS